MDFVDTFLAFWKGVLLNNNFLYYLLTSTCINFLTACLNTKSYFPHCRKWLSWSGKYFSSIDIFHFPLNLFHPPAVNQGVKLTFFPNSHLAPKYFKVVANSKQLVVIMTHTNNFYPVTVPHRCCQNIHSSYKEDTSMGHIQLERLPKSKMESSDNDIFTFEIVRVLHFRNRLNEELCCTFIFTNLQQSLDL